MQIQNFYNYNIAAIVIVDDLKIKPRTIILNHHPSSMCKYDQMTNEDPFSLLKNQHIGIRWSYMYFTVSETQNWQRKKSEEEMERIVIKA